ncbi:MAG: hypothetical protein OEV64_12420, partial [Desulfobulbaceae bacterium]|nr:hypothetical protein [Desulfobulbaceae bacterium]
LADADTTDSIEIERQQKQFQSIIENSERKDAKLVLAVPETEKWLKNFWEIPKSRGKRNFEILFRDLDDLRDNLDSRAKEEPSLSLLIEALKEIDNHTE